MFRTLSPCQGLLTRDQPDFIWTPHTDWKYSISQDPSHIHQTQTSGLPIVRLAVLSQHAWQPSSLSQLSRPATLHIGTSTKIWATLFIFKKKYMQKTRIQWRLGSQCSLPVCYFDEIALPPNGPRQTPTWNIHDLNSSRVTVIFLDHSRVPNLSR